MDKGILSLESSFDFITVHPVVLVTSHYGGSTNVMTASWITPISFVPPMVAIVAGNAQFSHNLIDNSREFAINVPDKSLLPAVKLCGALSGRDRNKFQEAGLSQLKAIKIKTPLVHECFAHIECEVFRSFALDQHTIFCGKVVSVMAERDILSEEGLIDLEKRQPILHVNQRSYGTIGKIFE